MKLPKYIEKPITKNVLGELKDGFNYIRQTPSIKFVLITLALVSLLVLPYATLIPVYAKDIFNGTASTFGVIDSVIGLGAFCGAIFLASLKPGRNLKRILATNTIIFGVGLVLFSHTTWYPLALVFAAICGFGMMSQITISNTLIQTTVDPAMRGRVISFYAMAFFGMQPLGGLLVGILSKWIGTPDTVMAQGLITIIIGILLFRFLRLDAAKLAQSGHSLPVETEKSSGLHP
jgi:MFS family permease